MNLFFANFFVGSFPSKLFVATRNKCLQRVVLLRYILTCKAVLIDQAGGADTCFTA